MGWGKADSRFDRHAGDGDAAAMEAPADFSQQDFWRWVRQHTSWDIVNGASNPLAYAYAVQAATRWRGGGQPAYAEVSPVRGAARFVLRLAQPATLLATTDAASTVAAPQGGLAYAGLRQKDKVSVTSAGETYFVRPTAREDGAVELATLFRPYWQARLAPSGMRSIGTERRHAP